MCIRSGNTDGSGWKFNLPMIGLYIFMLPGTLGAGDAQVRIMEKMMALEETLHELMAEIKNLDERVTALEKGSPARRRSKAPEPPRDVKKKKKKLIDIGQGFYALNLDYEGIVENTVFTGELENSGSRDYQFVLISVEVYDKKGKVLGKEVLNITGMPMGTTRPFKVTIYGVNVRDVASYSIKFVKGF